MTESCPAGLDARSAALLALAVWVGLCLPVWSNLWLTPAYTIAYLIPLLATGRGDEALATVGVVVPLVVALGQLWPMPCGATAGPSASSPRPRCATR